MLDQPQSPEDPLRVLPNAPFPAPPPFWKHFTASNIARLESIKACAASNDLPFDPTALPMELRYFIPPPPPSPSAKQYTTFNQPQAIDPSTSTTNVPDDTTLLIPVPSQSSPTTGVRNSLKALTSSLLLTFLQLMQTLSLDPASEATGQLLEHVKTLFINIHVLINSYRPHQAREGVVGMLEEKIEEGREEIRRCEDVKGRVEEFLKGLDIGKRGGGAEVNANGVAGAIDKIKDDEVKRMWKIIREMDQDDQVEEDDTMKDSEG